MVAESAWSFEDRTLLDVVRSGRGRRFERLELLGDAVADAVLLPWVYHWSTGSVAVMSGVRQRLASDASLSHLSLLTGLHGILPADVRGDGQVRADAVEALIGAAFVDGGWPAATVVCEVLFGSLLHEPEGRVDLAARVDAALTPHDTAWRWRSRTWAVGSDEAVESSGGAADPLVAEAEALLAGLRAVGPTTGTVWLALGSELRTALGDREAESDGGERSVAVEELRAELDRFDGVWMVPRDGLDADDLPAGDGPDGVVTGFESTLGTDLVHSELESLALRSGDEHRRLAFVGTGILKSAAALWAFEHLPGADESELHDSLQRQVALQRVARMAFTTGLSDLVPAGETPVDAVVLVRAALGVAAVDSGPAHAVGLASTWLEAVRVDDQSLVEVPMVSCRFVRGERARAVEVKVTTPMAEDSWTLEDPDTDHHVLALAGMRSAIDAMAARRGRSEAEGPLLLDAPRGVVESVEGSSNLLRYPDVAAAVADLVEVLARHRFRAIWFAEGGG